jgi:histidyl-tRNA synthetase
VASPAVGFAMGLERLIALMAPVSTIFPDVYIIAVDTVQAFMLAERLRERGVAVVLDCGATSEKAQRKRAANSGARLCIIAGDVFEVGPESFQTMEKVLNHVTNMLGFASSTQPTNR